jgi:hypothetical protein
MKSSILLAAAIAAGSIPAIAQEPMTGNNFEAAFYGDPDMRSIGLMTLAKNVSVESNMAPIHFICAPPGVTYLQGAKVIDAFMNTHPEFLNMSMHDIAAGSLMMAFPCQR